jgi:NADPH:quinone reductase-like Zn-dependent oxidoreductase
MRAIVQDVYGEPEVLRIEEVERPVPGEGQVLVEVKAASIHPGDWMASRGAPYLAIRPAFGFRRPRRSTPGFDVAGVVEEVGQGVDGLAVGDEVFGTAVSGSCAEFAVCDAEKVIRKPVRLTFEQAAGLTISGCAALHGLRDSAKVEPGRTVLINGASGGVGTHAIQIAKSLGASVTAVCSARNEGLVRSLGADDVIVYTDEDFTDGGRTWDVVFDNVGNHPMNRMRAAVADGGTYVPNNGTRGGKWFGTIGRILRAVIGSVFIPKQGRPFVSSEKQDDLEDLVALVEADELTPAVGATYPLEETAAAMREVAGGHVSGKIVIVP